MFFFLMILCFPLGIFVSATWTGIRDNNRRLFAFGVCSFMIWVSVAVFMTLAKVSGLI